jgi:hypothetical protein
MPPVDGRVAVLVPVVAPVFAPVPVDAPAVVVEPPEPEAGAAAVVVPVPAAALGPVLPSLAQATANGSARLAMASDLIVLCMGFLQLTPQQTWPEGEWF